MATNTGINRIVTATPTADSVPIWDGNANLSANNMLQGFNSITSAAGTTNLTVASSMYQLITGSTTQTIVLPNATTLELGTTYIINNQSTGNVTIQDNTPTTLVVLSTKRVIKYTLIANGSAAGTWQLGDATLVTNQQNFLTAGSGTYTPTAGTAYIIVEMTGGGGGSGGLPATSSNGSCSGGGGPGGYLKFMMNAAQIGTSLSYTVGTGGAGGAAGANAGSAGTATQFGNWTASAGLGGAAGSAAAAFGISAGGGNGANTVGTGIVIFNIRNQAAQSLFFTAAGSVVVFVCSNGGQNPLAFGNGSASPYYAANTGNFTVNGYINLPGFGYGGYGIGHFGASWGAAAGITGRFGAIYVTEYIYV